MPRQMRSRDDNQSASRVWTNSQSDFFFQRLSPETDTELRQTLPGSNPSCHNGIRKAISGYLYIFVFFHKPSTLSTF